MNSQTNCALYAATVGPLQPLSSFVIRKVRWLIGSNPSWFCSFELYHHYYMILTILHDQIVMI